jgi:hypothetical protein
MRVDGWARLSMGRRRWGSYRVMGIIGYVVALVLATALGTLLDVPLAQRMVIATAPPIAFLLAVIACSFCSLESCVRRAVAGLTWCSRTSRCGTNSASSCRQAADRG